VFAPLEDALDEEKKKREEKTAMDRTQKAEMVAWIGGVFDRHSVVVVANGGLSVSEFEALRGELREAGAKIKVIKNRLAKRALSGRPSEKLSHLFDGPTAIAFSEDPVAAAKAVKKFSKDNEKLKILGGAMGEEIFDEKGVSALAAMPSREDLLASIVSTITAPAANLASAIGAPGSTLAAILETLETREAA
jgi:large subunit ribosomal protein L10